MIRETVKNIVDDLTGALTRGAIYSLIEQEVKRIKRYGGKSSLLFVDLDNFKSINDLYGHLEGDKTLVSFVKILKNTLRESDIIVRYGGDEFIILLPSTSLESAENVASRIIKNLFDQNIKISCSIGIVEIPTHGSEPEILVEKADKAMYKAKQKGKGRFFTYLEETLYPKIPSKIFVGRQKEKAKLITLLNKHYPLVLIKGEAGIGKSRFAIECLKLIEDSKILFSQCYGSLSQIPYVPFQELIKRYREKDEIGFREIYSNLDSYQKQALRPIISDLIQPVAADIGIFKFFETFMQLLEEIADNKQLLIYIDDIHWIDSSSVNLINYIVRNTPQNIKILATARIEELETSYLKETLKKLLDEKLTIEFEIPTLEESSTFELVESILQAPAQDDLKKLIFQKTGGNPLFIEEVIKELFEKGHIVFEDDEWKLKEYDKIILPETIEVLLKNKIKKFSGEKVLEVAAITGQEFHIDLIANVTNLNRGHIYDVINKLLKENLIVQLNEDYFAFKEGLIRDAILNEISSAKKRYISRTILEVLENKLPSFGGKEELCAYHAWQSQDKEKIKFYSKLAAEKTKKAFAYDEAIRFLQWYVEAEDNEVEREKAFAEYVTLLSIKGELKKAIELLKDFIANNKVSALSYRKLAELLVESGDPHSAMEAIEKSLELEENAESLTLKAWILKRQFKIQESYNLLEDLLNRQDIQIDEKTLADAYNAQALNLMDLNQIDKALEFLEKAEEIRNRLQNIRGLGSVCVNRAIVLSRAGKYEEALKEYDRAEFYYRKAGYKSGLITVLNNKASIYLDLRRYEEALENFKKAAIESKKVFDRHLLALALNNISVTLRHMEYHQEALEAIKEAYQVASELGMKDALISIKRNLAYVHAIGFKDLEKSIPIINEVLKEIGSPKKTHASLIVYLQAIEIFLIAKDYDKVKELLETLKQALENSVYEELKINTYSIEMAFNFYFGKKEEFKQAFQKAWSIIEKADPKRRIDFWTTFLEGIADTFCYLGKGNITLKILNFLIKYSERNLFTQDVERFKRKIERVKRLFLVDSSQ
ncbi:MAG: diguanylate cyclase [bacterium]|nr:diguanylate cyclase [bacterium]